MNWSIGIRLAAGFAVAVMVLAGLLVFNIFELNKLANLQDEGAGG